MIFSFLEIAIGLVLLIWSADRFVLGASALARLMKLPPLLIGMVIVGFGTSAPELIVSALAAAGGNPGIALGNAYGSNIANIALILGLTACLSPVRVCSQVIRKELPILFAVTLLSFFILRDGAVTRGNACFLLATFFILLAWAIYQGLKNGQDALALDVEQEKEATLKFGWALLWTIVGLLVLILSSRLLVDGAVRMARLLGVDDLIIGLTIVAVGTSLPELASSIVAARKGEHDLVVGNILGSNLFNTLAVVGLAGVIRPIQVSHEIVIRDMPVMAGLTAALFVLGFGRKGRPGQITRTEGGLLLVCYATYVIVLIMKIIYRTA